MKINKARISIILFVFALFLSGCGDKKREAREVSLTKLDTPTGRCDVCKNQGEYVLYDPILDEERYYCNEHHGVAQVDYEVVCKVLTNDGKNNNSKTSTLKDGYGHDKFDAFTVAVNIVKGHLKSPSSASFCSANGATISLSENTWTISGWVDAQNSFGATLRNNFTVKITFQSKDKYITDSCTIN